MSASFPTGKQPEFDHKHCDKKVVYHQVNADAGNAESTVTFSKNNVMGDVVAQLVVRQPQDPMDSMIRGSNPVRGTRQICDSFSRVKMC